MFSKLSPSDLSLAPITNLYAFLRYLSQSTQAEFDDSEGIFRYSTPLPHPWFNGVICGRPASGQDSETITDIVRYFKSRGVTMFSWWLDPNLPASPWETQLLDAHFRPDRNTPGMAVFLAALRLGRSALPSVQIRPVEDLKTLRIWSEVFMQGYGLPVAWAPIYADLIAGAGLEFPLRNYLAYQNGQPVGTSSMLLDGEVAGIYNVATLEAARGQGIGSLLTSYPLREAQAFDCRLAVLQSTEMGFKVYQRLGFDKVCDVGYHYWREG